MSLEGEKVNSFRHLLHHLLGRLSSFQVCRSQANLMVFTCQCLFTPQKAKLQGTHLAALTFLIDAVWRTESSSKQSIPTEKQYASLADDILGKIVPFLERGDIKLPLHLVKKKLRHLSA